MKRVYQGIEFAEGIKTSFANFKDQYKGVQYFRNLAPDKREIALKEAYNIATSKEFKTPKDGNTTATVSESKEADTSEGN